MRGVKSKPALGGQFYTVGDTVTEAVLAYQQKYGKPCQVLQELVPRIPARITA